MANIGEKLLINFLGSQFEAHQLSMNLLLINSSPLGTFLDNKPAKKKTRCAYWRKTRRNEGQVWRRTTEIALRRSARKTGTWKRSAAKATRRSYEYVFISRVPKACDKFGCFAVFMQRYLTGIRKILQRLVVSHTAPAESRQWHFRLTAPATKLSLKTRM